jgi:hypothetical protein
MGRTIGRQTDAARLGNGSCSPTLPRRKTNKNLKSGNRNNSIKSKENFHKNPTRFTRNTDVTALPPSFDYWNKKLVHDTLTLI